MCYAVALRRSLCWIFRKELVARLTGMEKDNVEILPDDMPCTLFHLTITHNNQQYTVSAVSHCFRTAGCTS